MRSAESLLRRADGWVFAPADARRLAAVRIGLCGVLALRLATTDYSAVTGQPAALFQPVFYMRLFTHMPSQEVATVLQACGVAAAVAAAAGLALRATLPLAFACSLVLEGMLNSAGRVIVGDALLLLCLLVLLAAGRAAGEAWSVRPRHPISPSARFGWPVQTMTITIALAYFLAGVQKWRFSGLAWITSGNLRWILYAASDSRSHPNHLALFVADRPLLAHVVAAGALLLETFFPLVLLVPRLRWLFVPAVVAMHAGIWLTIGLGYWTQLLVVVIVFVNWPRALARLREAATRIPALPPAPG